MNNPCSPSPCGPHSHCRVVSEHPVCSCLPNCIGNPPQCRPECITNTDCMPNLACIQNKCVNPCIGACGLDTTCIVISHSPVCTCDLSYTGDPYSGCSRQNTCKTMPLYLTFLI